MTWTPEKRVELHKTIGPYTMIPERSKDNETAYLISGFGDGREVRILPDPANTAQKRARTITRALTRLLIYSDDADTAVTSLIGTVALAGFSYQVLDSTVDPLEEWLGKWFVDVDLSNPDLPKYLIDDLDHAGWTISGKAV